MARTRGALEVNALAGKMRSTGIGAFGDAKSDFPARSECANVTFNPEFGKYVDWALAHGKRQDSAEGGACYTKYNPSGKNVCPYDPTDSSTVGYWQCMAGDQETGQYGNVTPTRASGGQGLSVPKPTSAADLVAQTTAEFNRIFNQGQQQNVTAEGSGGAPAAASGSIFAKIPVIPIVAGGAAILMLVMISKRRKSGVAGLGHSGRLDRHGGHRMFRGGKFVGYHIHRRRARR